MRNEAADIVQDKSEELRESGRSLKDKAKNMGNAALSATKAKYGVLSDKTSEYSKLADRSIRDNPYASLGIALGVGLLVGFLISKSTED